ncbi:hypothetical protein HYR99_33140 [Candidatus Poribacteria bacterium]|nr:hypothetical protein [Candidatus Poribacteria bacterium]
MKKHTSILMFLFPRLRPICCCCSLIIVLVLIGRTATADPPPALTAPADGAKFGDALPLLKWVVSKGATSYSVQIATEDQFKNVVVTQPNLKPTEWAVPAGKLAPGKHFWRVNATGVTGTGEWSTPWTFSLVPPSPPALTTPADGAKFVDALPTLKWTFSQGADSYSVQIAKDESFNTVVMEQRNLTVTAWSVPSGKLTSGKHFWRVNATGVTGTGEWSTPWTFSLVPPSPPALIAPADGAAFVDALPLLKWAVPQGATSYSVQIATDEQFKTVIIDPKNIKTTEWTVPTGKLTSGKHYWRMNATGVTGTGDWSQPWSFSLVPPKPSVLSTPADGMVFVDTLTPTLKWQASLNATAYGIQIAKDDQFTAIVIEQTKIAKTEYTVPTGKLEGKKTYYWRVNATGVTGTGDWSQPWSFSLIPPKPPVLSTPADGAAFVDTLTPTLKWQTSLNATAYGVQIAKDDKFTAIVIEQAKIAKTEYPVPAGKLEPNKTYYWRVNATGVTGTGDWSQPWSFNLVPPKPPVLSTPADGTVFVDTLTPTLKWQASQGAASYGVQIAKDDKFTAIIIEQTKITQTEYPTPAGKPAPGKYFWRVNATGITGTGEWSNPWSFTVDAVNILIAPVITVNRADATFSIQIEKAQNLYGFQFDLQFDPRVLEVVNVTEGGFLKKIGGNTTFLKPPIDNTQGIIKNVAVTRASPDEVGGAGTLVTIQVRFKQAGTSPIRFTRVKLSNEGF